MGGVNKVISVVEDECIEILDTNTQKSRVSVKTCPSKTSGLSNDNGPKKLPPQTNSNDIDKVIGVMEKSVLKGKTIHVAKSNKVQDSRNVTNLSIPPIAKKHKSDTVTVIDSSDE